MAVITISREYGSVNDDFGERVAQALGYPCVCKEFMAQVLAQYGLIEFEREYESKPGFWNSLNSMRGERRSEVVTMLTQVMQAVAQHGNAVIQGRSGFVPLRGLADVLHVRLQAPLESRIARIASQQQVSLEEAGRIVKEADGIRTGFVEGFYGVSWNSMHSFDLVLNTEKLPVETALAWVVEAAELLDQQPANGRPTAKALQVDDVLAGEVARQLERAAIPC
jgi:cytidylate kinase